MIPSSQGGPQEDQRELDDLAQQPQAVSPESPDAGEAEGEDKVVELQEARARLLRTQAELENFRKRSRRELEDEKRYAALPLLRDLLPVLDNLNRAIASAEQIENASSLLDGVKMVAEQFQGVLKQHQCVSIEADGEKFDPNLHEAIAQLPSEEHAPGSVSQVTQRGYRLHDRVVRPAQVIVAAPSTQDPTRNNEAE